MAPTILLRALVWPESLRPIVCSRGMTHDLASEASIVMKRRGEGGMGTGEEDPIALLAFVS
jgi:hypothetical protein